MLHCSAGAPSFLLCFRCSPLLFVAVSHSASFDSFLASLDAAPALPGTPIPFAASLAYLPLVQQPGQQIMPAIFGDEKDGARLFIRSCYSGLWKLIATQSEQYSMRATVSGGALITGNAGVGKSVFLAYVLKQLRSLAKPPTIVYDGISAKKCYIIRAGAAQAEMYEDVAAKMVDDPAVVYLVDIGATALRGPLQCAAFTIVVASPHAKSKDIVQHWWSHAKFPPVWYMPCWSEAELQTCRRVICPTDDEVKTDALQGIRLLPAVSAPSITKRVQQFGGIARVAFSPDSALPGLESKLATAIKSCDLEIVANQAGGDLDLLPESSSWLLHYVVDPVSFKLANIVFASKPILEEVWQRFGAGHNDTVLRFLNATSKNPTWSGARGNLFEPLAHERLQDGGTFSVQRFIDPLSTKRGAKGERDAAISSLVINASPMPALGVANTAAIASLAAGQYGEPSRSNFPAIDGVLKPNMLFQMTVGATHDVNIDGLLAAIDALQLQPTDPPPRLYFVVPPQQFATFQIGAFVSSHAPATLASTIPKQVEYWVLQLYAPSEAPGKRKAPASAASAPPSPKAAAAPVTLPAAAAGATSCSCKGPCATSACSCKKKGVDCNNNCHSGLAVALSDPLHRHKNCKNHA